MRIVRLSLMTLIGVGGATPASGQQCVLHTVATRPIAPEAVRVVDLDWIRQALTLPEPRVTRLGARTADTRYGPNGDLPYDLRTSSNLGRLQAEVYFQLTRRAERENVDAPLYVRSSDWFWTLLAASGADSASAPPSALNSLAHNQGIQLDARPGRVVRRVKKGPEPVFAINVRTWWPEQDARSKYTYQDTLTSPPIQVTSKRLISYRLLDFGDMIVYDQIKGSSGKPLEGFLSVLFDALGEANLKQSRMALSADGLLVVRGTGKWIIKKSKTFVIDPDGVVSDVPEDRPDLQLIKKRLEEDLDIDYYDMEWGCGTELAPVIATIADDGIGG